MLNNTIAITYSNTSIHREYQREFFKLYSDKFYKTIEYTEDDIRGTDFWNSNQQMFQYKKYGGYFLWKPYIILKTLQENPNQDVLYCDSNLRFTNMSEFERIYKIQIAKQGAFFVKHVNFINRDWTKRDTFILMDSDSEECWNSNQVWTPLMGFSNSVQLLNEYMMYCKIPQAVTEQPNELGENLEGFREHRWEQSVMSILAQKYGYEGIPDSLVMNWVTKLYSNELIKMKESVNADPLATV